MKKFKKRFALVAMTLLSLTSCDFFELDPVSTSTPSSTTSPTISSSTPSSSDSSPTSPTKPSTTPSTPSTSVTPPVTEIDGVPVSEIPQGYELAWHDEFNGNTLNSNYWEHQTGDGCSYSICGWGNSELQWYQGDNTSVRDGKMYITAKRQSVGGKSFTSSRIRSINKVSTKYGKIVARMSLPEGQALWPAFWMLPETSSPYGGWPHSGEIDIMEVRGRLPGESTSALHFSHASDGSHQYRSGTYTFPANKNITQMNTYGVEWDEQKISFIVNDFAYFTVYRDEWSTQAAPNNPVAPFDQNFHILFNFALGGQFDGYNEPEASFQQADMIVDYVRIFKKK